MYAPDKQPVTLEELDWEQFITLQESNAEEGPLIKLAFSMDTPYLQKDFNLDLIIWNLTRDNMEHTKKVVYYVLKNFNKLFETAWTTLYYYLRDVTPYFGEHTLKEFYEEQVDFESTYYSIQLEINCDYLHDGAARYCFVVATTCSSKKWMISDDDMRVYMIGNKVSSFDSNNDDTQMCIDWKSWSAMYERKEWLEYITKAEEKMDNDHFQYAEMF